MLCFVAYCFIAFCFGSITRLIGTLFRKLPLSKRKTSRSEKGNSRCKLTFDHNITFELIDITEEVIESDGTIIKKLSLLPEFIWAQLFKASLA